MRSCPYWRGALVRGYAFDVWGVLERSGEEAL